MSAEFVVDKFGISLSYKSVFFNYCLKQLITITWLSVFELFFYFFLSKKTFLLAYVNYWGIMAQTLKILTDAYTSRIVRGQSTLKDVIER